MILNQTTIDYKHITVVVYPPGAGGKFLINCLSLNDQAVFQDAHLALNQIQKKFTVKNKIDYLKKNLQESKEQKVWLDLNLGHGQLFQLSSEDYGTNFSQIICNKMNSGIISRCMQTNLHLFADAHFFSEMYNIQKIWINCTVIVFTNYRNFITQRKIAQSSNEKKYKKMIEYWETIKANNWPDNPPKTHKEFKELNQSIQTEIIDYYHNEIVHFFDYTDEKDVLWANQAISILESDNAFEFNVNYAYKNSTQFYEVYYNTCNFLQLPIQGKKIIQWYFDEWQDTLNIVSSA